jgi:hypothetical protein
MASLFPLPIDFAKEENMTMPKLHFKIITVLLPLIFLVQPILFAQSNALDGQTFVAELGEKGKKAHEDSDIISFKEGKFHSSSCDKYGYNLAAYSVSTSGDAMTFDAETVSESDGKLKWHGVIKGPEIEGSYIHYPKPGFFRRNPAPVENWFKGKLK